MRASDRTASIVRSLRVWRHVVASERIRRDIGRAVVNASAERIGS